MILLSFFRALKFSLQDIGRNLWLSLVTVTIIALALFSINMLLAIRVISNRAVDIVKKKVDISIYLKSDAPEEDILNLKSRFESLPEVKEVEYVSKAQALEFFKEKNKNNPEILKALREIGKNPLTPSLIIKPKNVSSADELANQLNKIESDIIESRNFTNPKLLLSKINAITDKINRAGLFISLMFIVITLLVVFNAVRVAIYTHRKEIGIMKLVGASNSFVYTPFIFSSLIYTLIGIMAVILVFYPFLSLLQPYLEAFFIGYDINLIKYFNSNFNYIFGFQFLGMALINILASFIAVRKYAQV